MTFAAVSLGLTGWFAFTAFLNLVLLKRPRLASEGPTFAVLIPARNEALKIGELVRTLVGQGIPVFVFDDESDDGTGDLAEAAGATVLRATEPLPDGWTGKNRGSHALGHHALEHTDYDWIVFLDADTYPAPTFAQAIRGATSDASPSVGVITALPTILPGRRFEPVCLAWVGALILSTNPLGLVSRVEKGHSRFLNGQFHAWRREVYRDLDPNYAVRGAVLEDVKMARLCANKNVRVDTLDLTEHLAVRMYDTPQQAIDGMSKNSYEITGSTGGTVFLAAFMLFWGWGWAFLGPQWWLGLGLLALGGLFVGLTVRANKAVALSMPIILTIGAFVVLRSIVWHKTGRVEWKGRVYRGFNKNDAD